MKDLLKYAKGQRLYMVLTAITLLSSFLALITFEYWDLDSMTAWTMNFWDLFFEGRLGEFYDYTALNIHGAQHSNFVAFALVFVEPAVVARKLRGGV